MAWTIEISEPAKKQFLKLHNRDAIRILDFLKDELTKLNDPRDIGKSLKGPLKLWRYRVGDYRIICDLQYNRLTILVLEMGHRSKIYK